MAQLMAQMEEEMVGMGIESVDPRGDLMATQTWRCAALLALPSFLSS
jgi:hypothetical protein